jgi:hypothetical protein
MKGTKVKLLIGTVLLALVFGSAQAGAARADYVQQAWWTWGGQWGPTLHIVPTWQARLYGTTNPGGVMTEALQKSGMWMWTNSLYNQLRCHLDYASWKTPYNLDAGRPDVGYWSTVRYGCNPPNGLSSLP